MDEKHTKNSEQFLPGSWFKRNRWALLWLFILIAAIATPLIAVFIFNATIIFASALFIAPVIFGGIAFINLIVTVLQSRATQAQSSVNKKNDTLAIESSTNLDTKVTQNSLVLNEVGGNLSNNKIPDLNNNSNFSNKSEEEKLEEIKLDCRKRTLSLESAIYLISLYKKEKIFFKKETDEAVKINQEMIDERYSDSKRFEMLNEFCRSQKISEKWNKINKKVEITFCDDFLYRCHEFNLEKFKEFFHDNPDCLTYKDKYGHNVLHLLCFQPLANTDLVSYMIQQEKSLLNSKSNAMQTPLMQACFKLNESLVKILLEHKVNVELSDKEGQDAMHMVFYGQYCRFHGEVSESSSNNNCERKNKLKSIKNITEYLLKAGGELNKENPKEKTILDIACAKGHKEIILFLIEKGAELNFFKKCNDLYKNIEYYISEKILSDEVILESLLKKGLNPNNCLTVRKVDQDSLSSSNTYRCVQRSYTQSYTQLALENNNKKIFNVLLKYGANFNLNQLKAFKIADKEKFQKNWPELNYLIDLLKESSANEIGEKYSNISFSYDVPKYFLKNQAMTFILCLKYGGAFFKENKVPKPIMYNIINRFSSSEVMNVLNDKKFKEDCTKSLKK